jgi:hypothetical protein
MELGLMAVIVGLLLLVIALWLVSRRSKTRLPGTESRIFSPQVHSTDHADVGSRRSKNSPSRAENRIFFTQVHGIDHKNSDGSRRQAIIANCHVGEELVLVPEPSNRYDANAVRICRQSGDQLGYWVADGRMANNLAIGWTYRVTIDEIYSFKENHKKHGVRLRVEVLTMSRRTEERRKRAENIEVAPEQRL